MVKAESTVVRLLRSSFCNHFATLPHPISLMADYKVYRDQKFLLPRRYKLIKVLGSGSYGVVCSVVDTKARDQCVELAVKKVGRIFKDPILMRRAIRELRLMRFLRGHRNVCN
ncbi:middle sporulation-specific mitogen-activated protein kinase [Candidozyma auris]|nr:middle sporulation-specific mitogen-activated protein kinase [[Candida] auris]